MRKSRSAVFNVRVDITDVATLHRHFAEQGNVFKAVSSLTRRTLQLFTEILVNRLGVKPFDSVEEAVNYLESYGLMKPLRTRGARSVAVSLEQESMLAEGISLSYGERKGKDRVDLDQIKRAQQLFKERAEQKREENLGAILGATPGEIKE